MFPLSGAIPADGFFLVAGGSDGSVDGLDLPTPDVSIAAGLQLFGQVVVIASDAVTPGGEECPG